MAKKSQGQAKKRSRPAAKRDLVRRPKASAYAKRTASGRFTEMDDVGRSQKADNRARRGRESAAATGIEATRVRGPLVDPAGKGVPCSSGRHTD